MKNGGRTSDVCKITLDNGLTALILADRKSDVASVVHWVKAGYYNEEDSELGISHFLEHLFFKGSKTRRMEEINDEIKGLGGYLNAGTIYDHTYFYSVLPASNIHSAVEVISDILLNPNFTEKEIESEKPVVIQEIKKKLDSPDQLGFERLVEMAFEKHRIRRFRMGYREDIESFTKEKVENYYSNFYKPNNSIVALVGNFNPERVAKSVRELYGSWERGAIRNSGSQNEPPQSKPKHTSIFADIMQSHLKIGFHVPSVLEDDFYPVNFASSVLGKGRSSRLFKRIKEDLSLVDGIGTSLYADKEIGYLAVEAVLKSENLASARREIALEIRKLIDEPPAEEEFEKVRNILETNYFADKEDVLGQAYNMAYFESLGDYNLSKDFLLKALSVTRDEIQKAAARFFSLNNLSMLEYNQGRPKKGKKSQNYSMKESVLSNLRDVLPLEGAAGGEPAAKRDFSGEDFPFSWLADHSSGKVQTSSVPGRLTLIMKRNTGVPMISSALYVPGGRLDENEADCGITNLVLRSTLKGAGSMSAIEVAQKLESLGCSLRIEATADNFGYAFTCLNKNFKDAFSVIKMILAEPSFSEEEVEKEKLSMKAAMLSRKDDMFRYPIDLCYRALFGIHPYGLPRFGTEESLAGLTRQDVVSWYESRFDWSKMIACCVGQTDDETKSLFVRQFENMPRCKSKTARILPLVVNRGIKESVEKRIKNQTAFALGFRTPGMNSGDYYPLEVLQNLLSGMGGRLYMQVREKAGLAYTVTGFNISLLQTGAFVIYAATSPKKEDRAREIILKEIERVKKEKIPAQEIKRAKNYTIGSASIALQTNLAQVYEYLRYYFVKKDLEEMERFSAEINAVKEDDLKRVLDKHFNLDNYAIGIVRGD